MRLPVILLMIAFATCGASLAETDKRSPKAVFESDKAMDDLTACLVPALSWMGGPSVSPAGQGKTRVAADYQGIAVLNLILVAGAPNKLELRTHLSKRVRKSIEGCL